MAWLLSFPGSGNTMVRALLEASTARLTGSVYSDASLATIFEAEVGKGNCPPGTVAMKSHATYLRQSGDHGWQWHQHGWPECNLTRAIYLVRNPYGALLAAYQEAHADHASRSSPPGTNRHVAALDAAALWSVHNGSWPAAARRMAAAWNRHVWAHLSYSHEQEARRRDEGAPPPRAAPAPSAAHQRSATISATDEVETPTRLPLLVVPFETLTDVDSPERILVLQRIGAFARTAISPERARCAFAHAATYKREARASQADARLGGRGVATNE